MNNLKKEGEYLDTNENMAPASKFFLSGDQNHNTLTVTTFLNIPPT
jgi:hypothetical protein